MNTPRVSLLVALITLMAAGVYISATHPEAALAATWTPPPATGCFAPAEAYLIDWQTQTGAAGRDTTYTPVWTDYPPGVFRFRTAAYSFTRNASGAVVGWNIGRPTTGVGCALSATDTLWSNWSGWANGTAPGRPGDPVFGAVLK